jgi:tryptophan-rich sensory protein
VFFGLQNMLGGLMVLGFGIASLLVVLALVLRVRRSAALLLLPYCAWLCFAGVLNYQFIVTNPDGGAQHDGAVTRIDLSAAQGWTTAKAIAK